MSSLKLKNPYYAITMNLMGLWAFLNATFVYPTKRAWKSASSSMAGTAELLILSVGGILVVVGVTIVQPALNNLTTGTSPVVSPGSTTATLIPYVALFLILAYLVLIIAVVIKAFRA